MKKQVLAVWLVLLMVSFVGFGCRDVKESKSVIYSNPNVVVVDVGHIVDSLDIIGNLVAGNKIIIDGSKSYNSQGGNLQISCSVRSHAGILIEPVVLTEGLLKSPLNPTAFRIGLQEAGKYEIEVELSDDEGNTKVELLTLNVLPLSIICTPADGSTELSLNPAIGAKSNGDNTRYYVKVYRVSTGWYEKATNSSESEFGVGLCEYGEIVCYYIEATNNGYGLVIAEVSFTVAAENSPPVIESFSVISEKTIQGDAIELGVIASDPEKNDLAYSYEILEYASLQKPYLEFADTQNPILIGAYKPGEYIVRAVVSDGEASDYKDILITLAPLVVYNFIPADGFVIGEKENILISFELNNPNLHYVKILVGRCSSFNEEAKSEALTDNFSLLFNGEYGETYCVKIYVYADANFEHLVEVFPSAASAFSFSIVREVGVNYRPIADTGPNRTIQEEGFVQLDGSGSSDPDGDALSYFWQIEDQPSGSNTFLGDPNTPFPSFSADTVGTYILGLTVSDGEFSVSDTVVITVQEDTPSKPVANAGINRSVLINSIVNLDGSGSYDPDLNSISCFWTVTSSPGASSCEWITNNNICKPSLKVKKAGTYTLKLVVNNGEMNSDPDVMTITVQEQPSDLYLTMVSPQDASINVAVFNLVLDWNSNGASDVYFGRAGEPVKVASNISATSYTVSSVLAYDTVYEWRIIVRRGEEFLEGPQMTFRTMEEPIIEENDISLSTAGILKIKHILNYVSPEAANAIMAGTAGICFVSDVNGWSNIGDAKASFITGNGGFDDYVLLMDLNTLPFRIGIPERFNFIVYDKATNSRIDWLHLLEFTGEDAEGFIYFTVGNNDEVIAIVKLGDHDFRKVVRATEADNVIER